MLKLTTLALLCATTAASNTTVAQRHLDWVGKCGNVQWNTDYWGNDIANKGVGSREECCDYCTSTPGCVLAVHTGSQCYLKNKRGDASYKHDATVLPNPNAFQCTLQENETDYYGNDIGSTQRSNAGECCNDCMANNQCVVAVFTGGTCWLKNKIENKGYKQGAAAVFSGRKPTPSGPPNDNGSGLWGGNVKIINNMPKVCIYTDKTITYFTPNWGRGDLKTGTDVTVGPFGRGWYTLGVQENVFAKCAWAGTCAWDNKSADNYCYNFRLTKDCQVLYNDCPWPPGNPSPAPDGRKRYTITGQIQGGTCVLTVNPTGGGAFYCDAKPGR